MSGDDDTPEAFQEISSERERLNSMLKDQHKYLQPVTPGEDSVYRCISLELFQIEDRYPLVKQLVETFIEMQKDADVPGNMTEVASVLRRQIHVYFIDSSELCCETYSPTETILDEQLALQPDLRVLSLARSSGLHYDHVREIPRNHAPLAHPGVDGVY
jgi:hypothetical protein